MTSAKRPAPGQWWFGHSTEARSSDIGSDNPNILNENPSLRTEFTHASLTGQGIREL